MVGRRRYRLLFKVTKAIQQFTHMTFLLLQIFRHPVDLAANYGYGRPKRCVYVVIVV